ASAGVAAGCWSAAVAVGLAAIAAPVPITMLHSAARARPWICFIATLLSVMREHCRKRRTSCATARVLPDIFRRHPFGRARTAGLHRMKPNRWKRPGREGIDENGWIHPHIIQTDIPVPMRTGGPARGAPFAQHLAASQRVAKLDVDGRQVAEHAD